MFYLFKYNMIHNTHLLFHNLFSKRSVFMAQIRIRAQKSDVIRNDVIPDRMSPIINPKTKHSGPQTRAQHMYNILCVVESNTGPSIVWFMPHFLFTYYMRRNLKLLLHVFYM